MVRLISEKKDRLEDALLDEFSKSFLKDKIILLAGFMASGKSFFGKMLASELNCDLFDTDELVEHKETQCIADIFKQKGEKYFRRQERHVLKNLVYNENTDNRPLVVAGGGGLLISKANQKLIKTFKWNKGLYDNSGWFVIVLNPPFSCIYDRLKGSKRPLVFRRSRKKIFELWSQRYKTYQLMADISITETGTEEIFKMLNHRIKVLNNAISDTLQ